MCTLPQISEAEYEVMKIIWDYHPISTNDICEKSILANNWTKKTVCTLLSRLYAKQAAGYEKKNRMFYYFPLVKKEDYLHKENSTFLNRFYNGEMTAMFSSLINETPVSKEDLEELYALIGSKLDEDE